MRHLLQPDAILLDARTLRRDAVLVVEDGRVQACLPAAEAGPSTRRRRYQGELWAAAPLLLHAHLESHDAPSAVWPRESFAGWAARLLSWREESDRLAAAESALESLRELAAAGCGLVVVHHAERGADGHDRQFGEPPVLPEVLPLRELFAPEVELSKALLREIDSRPPRAGTGYALHAPYSVSEPLARGVFARARAWSVPVSIHLGEHEEERRYLASGEGPLAELLHARGRPGKPRHWSSPVDWLADVGGLAPPVLVVHGTDLDESERRRLHEAGVPRVWCPGTHLYFDRPRPRRVPGEPVPLLGCDSRASNAALDPLRELRLARALDPAPGPQAWWHALSEGAAAALGRPALGHLRPGASARILRLPWDGGAGAAEVTDRLSADPELKPLAPPLELGSR